MDNNLKTEQNGQLLNQREGISIFDSALACVIFILMTNAFSIILGFTGIKLVSGTFVYYLIHALSELMFAVSAIIIVYGRKKNLVIDTGMNNKVNAKIVGWCFLTSFVSIVGFGNLTNVFLEIFAYLGYSSVLGSIELSTFGQYLGMVLSSCIVAGFSEELLFRGVIQSGFKKWGIKISIGASALIFMLMHGNAEQTVHQFIIGVLIGYVFYKTNNLWIGVLIHIFNNFIPVTQAYLISTVTEVETMTETATVQIGLGNIVIDLIIAFITAWAGFYIIKLILNKIFKENEKLNGKKESNENLTSIKVDGDETHVEMSIEGAVISDEASQVKAERPKISAGTIVLFALAGLYLVGTWMIVTLMGFLA